MGSPMPMNTRWSTRLDAAEVQHLVEDLRRAEVAAEPHRAGGAERAGERAARLGGDADGAAAVAVAHEHGLHAGGRRAVRNSALTVPSAACASSTTSSVENGTRAASSSAQRGGEVRHRLVAAARRRPSSATPDGRGRRAGRARRASVEGGRSMGGGSWWHAAGPRRARPRRVGSGGDAPQQVPRPRRASPPGAPPSSSSSPAASPWGARSCATRRGTSTRTPTWRWTGAASALERRHVVFAVHKPAGLRQHGPRPAEPAHRRLARPEPRAALPGRPARRRHDGADPPHQRRRARAPPHPSLASRSRASTAPRSAGRRCATRRCAPCATGVELEDGRTAPARVRRLAPDRLELTIHEGRKRQVRRMCDAVGHPVVRLTRVAFGPLGLGDLAPGAHRRLSRRRSSGCAARRADGRAPQSAHRVLAPPRTVGASARRAGGAGAGRLRAGDEQLRAQRPARRRGLDRPPADPLHAVVEPVDVDLGARPVVRGRVVEVRRLVEVERRRRAAPSSYGSAWKIFVDWRSSAR